MFINLLKKPFLANLLYALIISFLLMLADITYGLSNPHFAFQFTQKELINKLLLVILLVSIIPKRKHRLIIFLFMTLASFLQYTYFEYFGKNINAIDFYLMQGNMQEIFDAFGGMIQIVLVPFFIVLFLYIAIYWIDLKLSTRVYHYKRGLMVFFVVILILFAQVFYLTNMREGKISHSESKFIYPTTNRHSSRNYFTSLNYFLFGILPKKLFNHKAEFPLLNKPQLIQKDLNRTIILVIGESLRFDKLSLENNKLTPRLQALKKDKNFFFKKVYSGGTMTKVSVSTLINRLKYPGGLIQVNQENNCLFKLAKENEFSTYFLSGQSTKHLQIIRDMMCPKYIDKLIDRDAFDQYMKPTGFDEDLQTLLEKLNIVGSKSLIVLQHRGSHVPYDKQYPKEFDKYTPYENTALYTDNSLSNLIDFVKTKATNETYLFYVSDHGELLGEGGKNGHGHLMKEVYEVPFIMVTNTDNKALKNQFKYIKNHFDISNVILSLLGYQAELAKNEEREITILNADLDGFSGYGVIKVKDGIESKIEFKKY